jgi:hypothetical protein
MLKQNDILSLPASIRPSQPMEDGMAEQLTNPIVKQIMEKALSSVSPGAIVRQAIECTKKGAVGGYRKKLTREETIEAMRVVTSIAKRFGLNPTTALVKPGRATTPNATYSLFFTEREMTTGVIGRNRRLTMWIGAHADSIRLIAKHARAAGHEVDEDALIGELAAVVPEFLEQFREDPVLDPDAELAGDIARIASWLTSPKRDCSLVEFLNGARRARMTYNVNTEALEFEEEPIIPSDSPPILPLFSRVVAVTEAAVMTEVRGTKPEKDVIFYAPTLQTVAKANCLITCKVGLGVDLSEDRRGLRMYFVLSPVTLFAVQTEGPRAGSENIIEIERLPEFGVPESVSNEYWVDTAWPKHFECAEFQHWAQEQDNEGNWCIETFWSRRWLPVTAETCALIFDDKNQHRSRNALLWFNRKETSVLPREALLEGGATSDRNRDRFSELLYAGAEPSITSLLLTEVEKRTRALEEFNLRTSTGERQKKLAFRALMRR